MESNTFSVLVDGELMKEFVRGRGIRQGDPSPPLVQYGDGEPKSKLQVSGEEKRY